MKKNSKDPDSLSPERLREKLELLRQQPNYARASARILDKLTREKERRPPYAIT